MLRSENGLIRLGAAYHERLVAGFCGAIIRTTTNNDRRNLLSLIGIRVPPLVPHSDLNQRMGTSNHMRLHSIANW